MSTMAPMTISMASPMLIVGLAIVAAPAPARCRVSFVKWLIPAWREKRKWLW